MSGKISAPTNNNCPRCGSAFVCGNQAGHVACWCAELPRLMTVPAQPAACYCPTRLRELLAAQRAAD